MEAPTPPSSRTAGPPMTTLSVADLCDPGTVGRLFVRLRRLTDLSQRELAQSVGVAQSTIARVEAGLGLPSLALLTRVLAVGGVEVSLHDPAGRVVAPVADDLVRDNQGRRFPAHLDVAPPDEVPYERWAYPRYDRPQAKGWYGLRASSDRPTASGKNVDARRAPRDDHPTVTQLATRERLLRGPQPRVLPEPAQPPECTCPDVCFEELCFETCPCQCEPRRGRSVVPWRSVR